MKRYDALKIILNIIPDRSPLIISLGLMSRTAHDIKDRSLNFYLTGSMGLTSSIALGIAVKSKETVVAIEGDGSLLMNLSSMATIGDRKPNNLIHILLDNNAYASCNAENTLSKIINFETLAKMVGYQCVNKISNTSMLSSIFSNALKSNQTTFLHIKIEKGEMKETTRIKNLPLITNRFMDFLIKGQHE